MVLYRTALSLELLPTFTLEVFSSFYRLTKPEILVCCVSLSLDLCRVVPKRPVAIAFTSSEDSALVADKSGDVWRYVSSNVGGKL